jgi:hypothetical protein
LILAEGIPLNRETAPDGANPVGLPQMGLGFRMVESLYPPDQPLDGGDPIENLTSNLKREFQFMIVSYDTIFVHRFKGFFPNLKSARKRDPYPRFANTFFS